MQPLIKWPGGKSREFSYIEHLIPEFNRYIEPFFGGGAVFFHLQPSRAVINDICVELVDFYRFIKGEKGYSRKTFKKELYKYAIYWEKIPKYIDLFKNKLVALYSTYKKGEIGTRGLSRLVIRYIGKEEKRFNGLFSREFCLDDVNLMKQITTNLISKIHRIKTIEVQRGTMPVQDLYKNIETAFRSGFYMHFRDVMNWNGIKYDISLAKKIANYYFIREFCYGSMFRFNTQGHFNIPYGGIAYNKKDFRSKVDHIFNRNTLQLLKNTRIESGDFERVMNKYKFNRNDFIFLDPPYDTDFSDYEKKEFDKKDQERLARFLYKTKAKFVLIIKSTPFILRLYKNKREIKITKFNKTYLYNMRGRNNRKVKHLVVYNF